MICPECGKKMSVTQTWPVTGHERKRLLKCKECGHTEMSTEYLDSHIKTVEKQHLTGGDVGEFVITHTI